MGDTEEDINPRTSETKAPETPPSKWEDADWPQTTVLKPGMWAAEASVWVQWENQGELAAPSRSILLAIESRLFSEVMAEYKTSTVYTTTVMYARAFLTALLQQEY